MSSRRYSDADLLRMINILTTLARSPLHSLPKDSDRFQPIDHKKYLPMLVEIGGINKKDGWYSLVDEEGVNQLIASYACRINSRPDRH